MPFSYPFSARSSNAVRRKERSPGTRSVVAVAQIEQRDLVYDSRCSSLLQDYQGLAQCDLQIHDGRSHHYQPGHQQF